MCRLCTTIKFTGLHLTSSCRGEDVPSEIQVLHGRLVPYIIWLKKQIRMASYRVVSRTRIETNESRHPSGNYNCSQCASSSNVTGYPEISFEDTQAYEVYLLAETLKKYGIITFLVIACICNTLAFLTTKRKSMSRLTSSVYLRTLAITDTLTLVFFAGNQSVILDDGLSDVICGLSRTLQHLFMMVSSWVIVCLTVERYISLNHPLRRKTWCSRRKAVISVLAITAVGLCLYLPFSWNMAAIQQYGVHKCVYTKETQEIMTTYHSTLCPTIVIILPSSIIISLNGLIIHSLLKHRRGSVSGGTAWRPSASKPALLRKADKVTVMLLVVSLYFPLCSSPRVLDGVVFRHYYVNSNRALTPVTSESRARDVANTNFRFSVLQLFMFSNYFVNFFFYIVFGKTFRVAFVSLSIDAVKMAKTFVTGRQQGKTRKNNEHSTPRPSQAGAPITTVQPSAGRPLVDVSVPRQHAKLNQSVNFNSRLGTFSHHRKSREVSKL